MGGGRGGGKEGAMCGVEMDIEGAPVEGGMWRVEVDIEDGMWGVEVDIEGIM